MVGLSVVLEGQRSGGTSNRLPQVLNKVSIMNVVGWNPPCSSLISPSPSMTYQKILPKTGFLEHCYLCHQRLLPGKDIYMYKGDRAFCSEECRCRQIFMDEEETTVTNRDICSLAAMKPPQTTTKTTSSSSSSSSSSSRNRKTARNRATNGFVY